MDNGAGSYRRVLDGDDAGIAEIVKDYKDGLILYLNGYVKKHLYRRRTGGGHFLPPNHEKTEFFGQEHI